MAFEEKESDSSIRNLNQFIKHPKKKSKRKTKKKKADYEGEPFNASFLTMENIRWWLYVSTNYLPPADKRVMFLPCAGGHKTRNKERIDYYGKKIIDPRKFISESTSHQFMKAIREDSRNERIILSEPCTLIPISIENNPLRSDYNLPVSFLSVQGEFIFIERLSHYLLKLKYLQPTRKYVFYFGSCHHFFILNYSNKLAGKPFEIIYRVPKRGTATYSKESKEFMTEIHKMEKTGNFIVPEPISIEAELKKRVGRYTHKPFLLALIEAERNGRSKTEVKETRIPLCKMDAFVDGFSEVYYQIGKEALTTL